MSKESTEEKTSPFSKLKSEFINALIEKIRGKEIRKQLAFLLNPETIEASSRLKHNEIMAINQADWLGRFFHRFQPLRAFWVGIEEDKDLFVEGRGGGYARWVISEKGKGREEAISFIGASKEQKVIAPIISALKGKSEGE